MNSKGGINYVEEVNDESVVQQETFPTNVRKAEDEEDSVVLLPLSEKQLTALAMVK